MGAPDKNVSTDNQPKGSAQNLSDTLDRKDEHVAAGQRRWADDSVEQPAGAADDRTQAATSRQGAAAAGGIAPQPGDPTSPAAADERAAARDHEQAQSGLGDDGPGSTYRA